MLGVILGGVLSGLALGMLGAGGTIIGLPMFLYLGGPQGHAAFGTNALGVTVIAALLLLWRVCKREINLVLGIAFAIPGLFGIAIGARLGLVYPAAKLVFLLSFLILVVAGWIGYLSTCPPRTPETGTGQPQREPGHASSIERRHILRIVPTAFIVGVISGFFAIGGGFLIVPGLALAAAIDLRGSARCSLVPIAAFAGLDAIEYALAGDVRFAASGVMIAAGIAGGAAGIFL
ncbi:MAG: sulfite exporter TauE/SafE family protein, partial [Xanthobacteraceae bacterium]